MYSLIDTDTDTNPNTMSAAPAAVARIDIMLNITYWRRATKYIKESDHSNAALYAIKRQVADIDRCVENARTRPQPPRPQ
jgi:hypothetical protein